MKKIYIYFTILFSLCLLASCGEIETCVHEYELVESKESTCSEKGYTLEKCSLCDKIKKTDKKLLEHNIIEEVIAPSCTEKGYTLKSCTNCNYEKKENIQEQLGHSFGDWETVKEATELSDGLKTRKCDICKFTEEVIIESKTYINLEFIKYPFNPNKTYECKTYEELSFIFNCALLKNTTTFKAIINFEVTDFNKLLKDLVKDEQVPIAFHVKASLLGNELTCTLDYSNNPCLETNINRYIQFDSLNLEKTNPTRSNTFDEFAINNSLYEYEVITSDQLYYALERGVKPICKEGSPSEIMYEKMKDILRDIISDDMNDVEKIKAIHDYIIMNVVYDQALLEYLYQNKDDVKDYKGFYLEGVLLDNRAVCEGMSKTFASMCNIEGIPCVVVEGYQKANPNGAGHSWNKVNVNGVWYIVDVTSDGTIINNEFEVVSYKYFMVDELTINRLYIGKQYNDIICDSIYDIYKDIEYSYMDSKHSFLINSQEELNQIIGYFENQNKDQYTIQFKINFDYGDSYIDEINKAYEQNNIDGSYTYINDNPVIMLIKNNK